MRPSHLGVARGSSPLTRGKPGPLTRGGRGRGLIPAHAGKTGTGSPVLVFYRAHPRSRGENTCSSRVISRRVGSSPLTRGKPVKLLLRGAGHGLIPAHAGKTASASPSAWTTWAHPRSRGENSDTFCGRGPGLGSSPLTRGKPVVRPRCRGVAGLIPAHAGKTIATGRDDISTSAHPRSRGENARPDDGAGTVKGSSPLTRGKPSIPRTGRIAAGLIPAHAGKTRGCASLPGPSRAHPRSRGENADRRR